MENKFIPARERSPEVAFRYEDNLLSMRGEAYPEDASAFFGPLLKELETYCEAIHGQALQVDFQLIYFNTSSAKALMNMIKILEASARSGTRVTLNWIFQKEDDVMREFGEDFSQDLQHVNFHLVER